MLNPKRVISVSQLTEYLKNLIETDFRLSNLWLRGEVSNVSKPSSGHLYLTLKDKTSTLKAVMFRADFSKVPFKIENGLEVVVRGRISIYEKGGIYQLYIQEIFPQGIGSLELAYQQLKEKLANEGLFDARHKKPIPKLPQKIGIITSPTGAVIKDFVKVVRRRFPAVDIFLVPTTVQGDEAPPQIVRGIELLNKYNVDVIVLARGGGSLEELWAFNTEEVAYGIFNSKVPIISAIGHETDFTIADMVADLRAATPSVAGELVIMSKEELKLRILKTQKQLYHSIKEMVQKYEERLDSANKRLLLSAQLMMNRKEDKLINLSAQLHALSPLQVLKRGYSICQNKNGNIVMSYDEIDEGEEIKVLLYKGFLKAKVEIKGES